ncbi:MAG TPA: UDP-N-acetylglucosamine 2-epimerase (non-hydrolyzing) [Bacteroidia bacterium]|jgi:UDP-GlcNAc3NAcA epimerase|nr:UDP-N-acetylglucosamine 2-epimerase (non-hydrolyzing) [Bacteroidia bacterium]
MMKEKDKKAKSIKILTVIGARPQIIKAAAFSRAIKEHFTGKIKEVILHTGQHYDNNMSEVFFKEMGIPSPDINLSIGSGSHGKQTAAMIDGIENALIKEKPNCLVVYGDTNSTLAAAIAASKIHVPLVHIEAGLRSFNKTMPEEINRIVCDHCSTLLFSPTKTGYNSLIREGFNPKNKPPFTMNHPGIYHCGDVMFDNTLYFSKIADKKTSIIQDLGLKGKKFVLLTIHRNNNTDDPKRLNDILGTLNQISIDNKLPFIFPAHPRTSKMMEQAGGLLKKIKANKLIQIIPPASFLEMLTLEKHCSMVITDSGGVQKEAFFLHKPCIVLRPETEWVELVECGNSILTDAHPKKIKDAFTHFEKKKGFKYPNVFGDGKAAEFICKEILRNF